MIDLKQIKNLIDRASAVVGAEEADDVELFLKSVTEYLEAFDVWQADLGDTATLSEEERERARPEVEKLNQMHNQVMAITESKKGLVTAEMKNLHKRAGALKKYIDRYPARITIAGKRKG